MKRICKLIAPLGLLVGATMPLEAAKKPNLLLIVTDEHNFRTIGCYRDQLTPDQAYVWGPEAFAETPHIDSLAETGAIFNRMYGSAPVCTASRGSMFTGMYPHTIGVPNNSNKEGDGKYLHADVPTIADALKDAGYMTGYVGKWHLGERKDYEKARGGKWWQPYPEDDPKDSYGFMENKYMFNGGHDKWYGIVTDGLPAKANAVDAPTKNGDPYVVSSRGKIPKLDRYETESGELFDEKIHDEQRDGKLPFYDDGSTKNVRFTTDWLTDRTLEFIEANKEQPFFCVVSIPDPHTPDSVRPPYNTMYNDVEIDVPATFHRAHSECGGESVPEWQCPSKTDDKEKLIENIRQYLGMVKCIDDNVGRMIKKLADEGLLENTIIVFSSDHGDLLGEHARVNKGTIHEASDKVPFVIAHGRSLATPMIPRGKVINAAANTTDWMPTFLSLLGVDCPKVAGRDLSPLLKEENPDWNDVTFVRLGFYAAVSARYKLQVHPRGDTWLLDIEKDPDERHNFIDDPAYREIAKKLARDMVNYIEANDDSNVLVAKKLDKILSM